MPKLTDRPSVLANIASGGYATVFDRMAELGRVPMISDEQKPWTFKGWLLPYVIQCHEVVPETGNRWGYQLRTIEAGRLLDGPIPRIHFEANKAIYKSIERWVRLCGQDMGGHSDFRLFVEWLSWGLGVAKDLPRIEDKANDALYRAVDVSVLLKAPADYLGEYLCMNYAHHFAGFFPTPHSLCELMVAMQIGDDGEDSRLKLVCDPCVGTGRLLLHASNYSLNLYGNDIDRLVLSICLINLALYAPWGAFPLPESIMPRAKSGPAPPSRDREIPPAVPLAIGPVDSQPMSPRAVEF